MPSSATAKTASAPKRRTKLQIIAVVVTGAVATLAFVVVAVARTQSITLHAGSQIYRLQAARTNYSREKGLSGRTSLPKNQGMLFVFQGEAVRCFWMKDTLFPLDMVWLNRQKQVLHIEANVQPGSYPAQFCPPVQARYVIELNAGEAGRAGLHTHETLTF